GNSPERRRMLEALGAEVELVPQVGGPRPGQVSGDDLARVEERTQGLVRELGAFRPDQFNNPDSARAHELATGAELLAQTGGRLDAFVAAVGTGGTFVGVARALKRHRPTIRCYAVEPAGAPVLAGQPVREPRHRLQGIGYAFVPPLWDAALCDGTLGISDAEATAAARALARREGLFCGFSSGANVAAALRVAAALPVGAVVATVLPDTGLKYLSTDLVP
ncbi:MAG: pyridoxal-phosphate dependent enzyme, partial [Chloroflexi bacterium]|nr:pyridoxal-phosphate dependent enzyme [Chloroflexota bacterium]